MADSYVRTQMIPPAPPPASQAGAVKWLRENLFSGWLNGFLTVFGLVIALAILQEVLVWGVVFSHWSLTSLGECRAADLLLSARGGFQFADLLSFPLVLVRELVVGLFTLDPVRILLSVKTAAESTWDAMNVAPASTGACWAMVRERWHQFIFGFYPPEEWWRPVLGFGLLFAALAPVLFAGQKRNLTIVLLAVLVFLMGALALAGAPGTAIGFAALLMLVLLGTAQVRPDRLLWFTAFYAVFVFWLLWGGSVWLPVAVLLGFGVGFGVFRLASGYVGVSVAAGLGAVAAALWWLRVDAPFVAALSQVVDLSLVPVGSDQFGGFLLAIIIGVTAIGCSLPLGILLALGRKSDLLIVKTLCVGFIEFVRGVPLITLLFTASLLLQYFLPPNTNFDIILRVIILVTLFAAAYLAEVIRGGLAALPRGQYEAADALGLDYWKAQRLIILPQALKISIPGIVSTFIGLFKDTTLVSFVGLMDPLRGVTQIVRADIDWKGIYWEPYIFVGVIFFLICFGMSRYSMYLEQKLKTDHR